MSCKHPGAFAHVTAWGGLRGPAAVVLLGILAGCAGLPDRIASLEDARTQVGSVAANEEVQRYSAEEINEARRHLAAADEAVEDGRPLEEIEHHAYMARQVAAIADARARQQAAEATIAQAGQARERIRLEARTRQAESAQARAEQAQARAEQSMAAAREARQASQQLEQESAHLRSQLADLEAKQTSRGWVVTLGDVLFDTAKAELKSGANRVIDQLVTLLRENPDRSLLIEGFTDSRGAESYNMDLSQRRADALRQALINAGVDPQRLQTRGYGESFPVASNDNPAGRQLNRRVEVVVSNEQGEIPMRSMR